LRRMCTIIGISFGIYIESVFRIIKKAICRAL
jgi:hypothetical protein